MVVPSREVISDLKDLISEVTLFKEGEENFAACEQYCLSHIMHDRFPTPDKTQIKNTLNNYSSRFFTHGMSNFSEALDEQVETFLKHKEIFKENPQYDIEWNLLSLLCHLSTKVSSPRSLPALLDTDAKDNVPENDLLKELLKLESPLVSYQRYDSLSSVSSLEEESYYSSVQSIPPEPSSSTSSFVQLSLETEDYEYSSIKTKDSDDEIKTDLYRKEFLSIWTHLMDKNFLRYDKFEVITEKTFLKLMLSSLRNGDISFFANHNFAFPSLNPVAVKTYISTFKCIADVIQSFNDFDKSIQNLSRNESIKVKKMTSISDVKSLSYLESEHIDANRSECTWTENDLTVASDDEGYLLTPLVQKSATTVYSSTGSAHGPSVPNTFKIYNASVKKILSAFYQEIMILEEQLDDKDTHLTALKVHNKLRDDCKVIKSLHTLHINATQNWQVNSNWQNVIRLLAVLYNAMVEATTLPKATIILNLFISSFQVYMDVIDNWFSTFLLSDYHNEFIVTRSRLCKTDLEWSTSFFIHPFKETLQLFNIDSPAFLDFIAYEITDAGKCLDVLVRLDRRGDIFFALHNDNINLQRSYEVLKEELQEVLSNKNNFQTTKKYLGSLKPDMWQISEVLNTREAIPPLHQYFERSLHQVLRKKVHSVCVLVKTIVMQEYHLTEHFNLLRNIFLHNNAYIIEPFLSMLFTQKSKWRNSYSLSVCFEECIESVYPDLASNFTLTVQENCSPPKNILEAIDGISIGYKLDFPLTLVITSEAMTKYCKIFALIVKLKWASQTVSRLLFPDLNKKPSVVKKRYHKLFILRFSILSLLIKVSNYFMAQVGSSLINEFEDCQYLPELISAHEEFINRIFCNCLLEDCNVDKLHVVTAQLIPLTVELELLWHHIETANTPRITSITNTLANCQTKWADIIRVLYEKEL